MTPTERAAFAAGIDAARHVALTAAVTIEVRTDAADPRQQAAIAALLRLAEGPQHLVLEPGTDTAHCIPADLCNDTRADDGRGAPP